MNIRQNLHMANACADEERKTIRRKLLLSEFQVGVWTHGEHQTEVHKLDEPNTPTCGSGPLLHMARLLIPLWKLQMLILTIILLVGYYTLEQSTDNMGI